MTTTRMHMAVMVGCSMVLLGGHAGAWAETGTAALEGTTPDSSVRGSATLTDTPEGLQVAVTVGGVSSGQHAWHIHQFGSCAEAGSAAGGHYNPDGVTHGFLPKDGLTAAHPGDLGNLDVGPDGSGASTVTLPGVTLSSGPYAVAGRAIILHEKVDDFGQPTGNAGSRIGCGVIVITGK